MFYRVLRGLCGLTALLILATALAAGHVLRLQFTALDRQGAALAELIAKKPLLLAEQQQLQQDLAAAEADMRQLQMTLPEGADEAGYLANVSRVAQRTNVQIHDFHTAAVISLPTHQEVEVSFRVEGQYADLCRFLESLRAIPRRCYATQFGVLAPSARGQNCSMDLQLRLAFDFHADANSSGTTQ